MPELILNNVDGGILHHLQNLAALHGRTPAEEVNVILADAVRSKVAWAPVDEIYHRHEKSGKIHSDSA
ncbi:hypothetical protein NA78x_005639 [Anatilimnocola sp. NA78]|uniref:hypothetical protein n=1 Tax=Anatilimnocola sp. NA78 TaxID=3415683 RepID=UPI003CE4EBF3